jgi:hypothetical protein
LQGAGADKDPDGAERYALKAWIGEGKSKPRRVSLDLHYNSRTSIWSEIAARSHLVVAAVGTVALLGTAGSAIWMVLPSGDRDDIVAFAEAAPAKLAPVVRAQPQPAAAQRQAEPSTATPATTEAAQPQPAAHDLGAPRGLSPIPVKAIKVAAQADVEPLDPTDPRWVEAAGKQAAAMVAAIAEDEQAAKEAKSVEAVNAFADDGDEAADTASTSSIPFAKMDAKPAEDGDPDQKVASAARASSAVRAVTMRTKPSSRGGAIGTVPAKASVEVVSCAKWCEIVYKGKRGFVYRSFLLNNGR